MNVKLRARGQGGEGEEGAGDRRVLAPQCLECRRCTEGVGCLDLEPQGGSVCSFGSVRLVDQGPAGVVLLPPQTVSCHIALVQSELRELGAITLCWWLGDATNALQAGYRWACNRPVHTEPKINSLLRKS